MISERMRGGVYAFGVDSYVSLLCFNRLDDDRNDFILTISLSGEVQLHKRRQENIVKPLGYTIYLFTLLNPRSISRRPASKLFSTEYKTKWSWIHCL